MGFTRSFIISEFQPPIRVYNSIGVRPILSIPIETYNKRGSRGIHEIKRPLIANSDIVSF